MLTAGWTSECAHFFPPIYRTTTLYVFSNGTLKKRKNKHFFTNPSVILYTTTLPLTPLFLFIFPVDYTSHHLLSPCSLCRHPPFLSVQMTGSPLSPCHHGCHLGSKLQCEAVWEFSVVPKMILGYFLLRHQGLQIQIVSVNITLSVPETPKNTPDATICMLNEEQVKGQYTF